MTNKTDRKNQLITYTYDQLNRLTGKTYPDNSSVNYTYDLNSQLTQVSDPTGTYQFTFDNMGRLASATTNYAFLTSRSFTTSYGYDAASNRTSFTDPENGATAYVYDTLNRLQTLTPPSAFTTGHFGFSYDTLSRRTQMTRPNGLATNYSYDNLSRLLSVLHQSGSTTLDGATYTVDNAVNRLTRTPQPTGTASNFTYDALYELTQVTQGANTTESYTYDPVGNRLSSLGVSPYGYNTSNELTSTPSASYGYDNNGNAVTKSDSTGITTYAWDFENRLTSVTLPGSGGTISFKYDPFGRRIYKSSSAGTSIFAYDWDNIVEETNSTGAAAARYENTQNIDELLGMLRSSATSFYHADGLGSVTSLSNASGSLAQTYTFDSFGKQTASSGSLTNPFQYTARESDTETGLYYYRARYYDPSAGRFLSEDPIGFNSAQDDFYSYAGNSPLGRVDPLGLAHCTFELNGFGGAGMLICIPDKPGDPIIMIPANSGNNADPEHKCRNNPDCPPDAHGPLPIGWYQFGGGPTPHHKDGTHLYPIPGAGTSNRGSDGRFLTHSCLRPFGPAQHPPFCSTGCIVSTPENIRALNQLLAAEPGSTLLVNMGNHQW